MKTEIIFPCIERPHCVDIVLTNIEKAIKPKNCQILCVISASDEYTAKMEKRLKQIFEKVRIVRNKEKGIDHNLLRESYKKYNTWNDTSTAKSKMARVCRTYELVRQNIDPTVDYYWIIEDDNLFPLDTYPRYMKYLKKLKADAVTGVSYGWRNQKNNSNFKNVIARRTFGEKDSSPEISYSFEVLEEQDEGYIENLKMAGLCNVLAKQKVVDGWSPKHYFNLNSGADVSFFRSIQKNNFKAYGMWEIKLAHFTKYQNGNVSILGQIDKSLINIINK